MGAKRKVEKIRKIIYVNIATAVLLGFWVPTQIVFKEAPHFVNILFDLYMLGLTYVRYRTFDAIFVERRQKDKKSDFARYTSLFSDILIALPFVTVLGIFFPMAQIKYLYLFKMLFASRALDVRKILYSDDSLNPIVARLLPLGLMVPIIVHSLSCGWIWLGAGSAGTSGHSIDDYIKAVYWCITTLSTVGYGDVVAKTNWQMIYAACTMIVGVAFFGYVLSNVASLLARLDSAREHYLGTLDKVEDFMRYNDLPIHLRKKIRSYYHYMWESHHGYDDNDIMLGLPQKLRAEVALSINSEIINKVPILKGTPTELLQEIVLQLQPIVAVPGQNVFNVGNPGDAMFFIHHGSVEVIMPDGKVVAQLHPGSFFGEMALLSNKPRNATVRALDYCDLFMLKREAFENVMKRHPEFEKIVRETAHHRKAS